jgi:menaquinone-9 beta-reductase
MSELGPYLDEAEIVVVGAGPAGCTAAALLAEQGHEVLLIDKNDFPRDKPCGDGLMHPALELTERLGLHDVIEAGWPIESARVVVGHRRADVKPLSHSAGRAQPRCIPRATFDAALLGAARARGARFLRARADRALESTNGTAAALAVHADGGAARVGAHTIVAVAGATSRLRRTAGGTQPPPAVYAVRQYFRSERPLDPVFDFYVPLELAGRVLFGYGWVFPIDDHTANVGVGFYRDICGPTPPLTAALHSFVEELQTKAGHRFGALESLGDPLGSPFGTRFDPARGETGGIVFAGDAAGTTHPITGEGIAFAMKAGELVADLVHARSVGTPRPDAGREMVRRFPQLGQDVTMVARTWVRELTKGLSGSNDRIREPFLTASKRLVSASAYETSAAGTPAWQALHAQSPGCAAALERANAALLDSLSTAFPITTELIARYVRSHLGPVYAAVAVAAGGAATADPEEPVIDAAVAVEALGAFPQLLGQVVDRSRSKGAKVNNVFAVLATDFVVTRSLDAACRLGAEGAAEVGRAAARMCTGGMRDAGERFSAVRTYESWLSAATATSGAAMSLAARLGAAAGDAALPDGVLDRYGVELGIATRLAEEIADLVDGDAELGTRPAIDLRRGIYPLAAIHALGADGRLPRLLAQGLEDDLAEAVALIEASGGLARAEAECERHAAAARALARELPSRYAEPLEALAALPLAGIAEPQATVTPAAQGA